MSDQVNRLNLTPWKQDFWRLTVFASLACQVLVTWYVQLQQYFNAAFANET